MDGSEGILSEIKIEYHHDDDAHDHSEKDHDQKHDHAEHSDHDHEQKDQDHKHKGHDHEHKDPKPSQTKKGKKEKNLSVVSEHDNYNLRAAMIHIIGSFPKSLPFSSSL